MVEYIEREKIGLTDFELVLCNGSYKEALKTLLDKIESIPASDVRPVVHAMWVHANRRGFICCSNCGNPVAFALKNDGLHYGDFCPKCGAMMEADAL